MLEEGYGFEGQLLRRRRTGWDLDSGTLETPGGQLFAQRAMDWYLEAIPVLAAALSLHHIGH